MSSRTPFSRALMLCAASVCALSAACAGSSSSRTKVVAEAPPAAATEPVATPEAAAPARSLPPPGASEVSAAVERVFKGAVTTGPAREPFFAVGDFNGDDSQDIAVAVGPAPGRLGEINDELANWIIKDPFAAASERGSAYGEVRRRTLVEESDALLAVIHGYGADGWRDARATQTYVLKDAAGNRIKSRAREAALSAGAEEKMPRLVGDVIAESIGGRDGFLYYDGARYLWYDPRVYKPLPPARVVHGGAVREVRQ
ncbi:MAG: hypothetical protein ABW250_20540 [Pyrinomonadaceae bacterium]